MTNLVKKGIPLGYLVLLTISTLAVTIYLSLLKPTSYITDTSGLEGALQQNLEQLSDQSDLNTQKELLSHGTDRSFEERVRVFELEGSDFTLALIAVEDEKQILEKVCNSFLQKLEELTEEKIRVLLISIQDEEKLPTIATLLPKTEADVCVILSLGSSDEPLRYGIEGCCNGAFYWERPSIQELCDAFVRNVAIQTQNRGEAFFQIEREDPLWAYEIPTMKLKLGYLTNEQEENLLSLEEYQDKIAEGLLQGLKEVYTISHEE